MKIHVITIGDEILIGQTLNSNASFIGSFLDSNSYIVTSCSTVGDNKEQILNEIQSSISQNDIVICTGGLGPTHDDVTLDAIVEVFETELVENSEVLKDIQDLFNKRKRELTQTNREQALVPKICEPIRNFNGTAPGIYIERKGKIFIALPGVPIEMQSMMEDFVIDKINEKFPPKYFTKNKVLLTTENSNIFLFSSQIVFIKWTAYFPLFSNISLKTFMSIQHTSDSIIAVAENSKF